MSERTPTQERLRQSRDALIDACKQAGAVFTRGNTCKCPFHEDTSPSAGVFKSKDGGTWLFKCQGCKVTGDIFDILARATNKPLADVLADARDSGEVKPGKRMEAYPLPESLAASYGMPLEAMYRYTNPDTGRDDLIILRMKTEKGKTFRQTHFNGDGWVKEKPPGLLPLFNRAAIRTAEMVIVVEGEKCVEAVATAGGVATTASGGADKAYLTDWKPLAGKTCVLWPDNDPKGADGKSKGIEHMRDIARILEQLNPPAKVSWIDPEELGLGEKEDAADYLAPCITAEQRRVSLEAALSLTTQVGGADELWEMLKDTVDGKRRSLQMPWSYLTSLSCALSPGTVTCVCGDPSSGKSFFTIELAWRLHKQGHKVAVFELEDDKAFHLNRALAQVDEKADWTNSEWVEKNPFELAKVMQRHGEFMAGFGPSITAMPDEEPTYAYLLNWVKERCEANANVIIIDPITAASSEGKPWVEDRQFVMAAKAMMRKFGSRLIIVTHPKVSSKPGSNLHSMAGGAAFPRFSHTVIWLHTLDEPRTYTVAGPYGNYTITANRTARISKARNGPGTGTQIAFTFEGTSLRFNEHGPIVKDDGQGVVKRSIAPTRLNSGPGTPSMQQDPFADDN